ncbi:CC166 protein, partial [Nothoprocta ornata]|nr:CC166 protein [Nothoprocta pentlandii]NWY07854.1 CC166 protein [Nothoprocta ornata]
MTSKKKKLKQDIVRAGTNKDGPRTKNAEISKGRSHTEALVRERKQYLQKEYETLSEHMNTYLGRVEHFLHENDILEKEAQQNQEESNAYLSYIAKHSQKYQNMIITLNDQNHTDLSQIKKQKEKLISEYAEKEKEVRNYLMDMEAKYSLMNTEVEGLRPFKDLQLEQMNKIKDLEKELLVTKIQHSEQMHKIKGKFLQAKAACEAECHQRIQFLTKKAEEAAVQSLIQHARQIKAENWHLRQELFNLIQCSHVLKAVRLRLQEQRQKLLQENQCSQDMARMRRRFPQH